MNTIQYAGFWLRFVAYIIDSIVIGLIQSILVLPVLAMMGFGIATMGTIENLQGEGAIMAVIGMISALGSILFISSILSIAYFTVMEASKFQGTLGKMALGLKVTDNNGNPLDFGRALLRNIGKIISQMIFMIGFIMAGLTAKKQALHDLIAGALVLQK